MNTENTNKNTKVLNIVSACLSGVAGLLTVIFAILAMANVSNIDATVAIRFVVGIGLIIVGIAMGIVALIQGKKSTSVTPVAIAGVTLAVGTFMLFDVAGGILNVFVGALIPMIIAGVGVFVIVKAIFSACNKLGAKVWVSMLCIGIVATAFGITFFALALNEDTAKVTVNIVWLIVGLIMVVGSIFTIANACKKAK